VLKWARITSGATVKDTADRVGVTPAAFARWETEETPLSLTQVRELSRYFKRPLAAFLLAEPPLEPSRPEDYRTLPGRKMGFDRETCLAIRKALRLRSIAKELMQSLQQEVVPALGRASLSAEPEQEAQRERERMGVSVEEQEKWRHEREAYRRWREEIERQNVLVFQLTMPVEDARGFSLGDDMPNAIAVNSSDAVRARVFTLFHEYAHLLLHTPGVCTPSLDVGKQKQGTDIENWCNRFAGAFLIPSQALQSGFADAVAKLEGQVLLDALKEGARTFKVSEQVVLRRLLDLELITRTSYKQEMEKLRAAAQLAKRKGGMVRPATKCLAENGVVFASLVLEARTRGLITYSDVGDFLNVRLKYLPQIESSLTNRAA